MPTRILVLVLATLACAAAWRPDATAADTVLVRAGTPVLAETTARARIATDAPGDAALTHVLGHLTPDDVARGMHALRTRPTETGEPVTSDILAHARAGRDARAARDALRTRRRGAEEAWLRATAQVVEALPPDARAALRERKVAP